MKQVRFRNIRLEGFRSYASPVVFQFGTTGLHLVKGLNGEGKTSLFSALVWCLYKTNLNSTTNSRIATFKWLRPKGYIGTRVIVNFTVGKYKYLVARHMDYKGKTRGLDGDNSLLIFRKEKTDESKITAADIVNDELYKADQQGYLNRLLGIDSKTFLNSVVFGQRMTRLMESKNEDKRDLFEQLFDADFIEALKEKAVKKYNTNSDAWAGYNKDLAAATASHEQLTKQVANAADILAEFKREKKARLAEIRTEYDEKVAEHEEVLASIKLLEKKKTKSDQTTKLNDLLQQADEKREALYDAKERHRHVKDDISNIERQSSNCELDLNTYKDKLAKVTDTCPYCGGKLDAKQVKATKFAIQEQIAEGLEIRKHLETKLKTLEESEKNIDQEVKVANSVFSVYMGSYEEAKKVGVLYDSTESQLTEALRKKDVVLSQIESLTEAHAKEKARKPPTVNVEELTAMLATVTAEKEELEKKVRRCTNLSKRLEWWIKTAFSAGGLKAYVFSAMLNKLNEHLATYTEYYGYNVTFGIDLSKPSKPFYGKVILDGEHEIDYSELSGGQKQKIDICIAFAMHDSISVKTSFNIIIFDEAAESLDIEAQEMFDTLLRIKSEKKAVYVISHNNHMDLSGCVEYEITGGNKGASLIQ